MQITETSTEGLKRTLKVVVGADELGKRFTERLDEIKDRVQLKGFRKGKVPVPHLKKMYGRSLMVEVLQETVKETSSQGDRRPQRAPGHAAERHACPRTRTRSSACSRARPTLPTR